MRAEGVIGPVCHFFGNMLGVRGPGEDPNLVGFGEFWRAGSGSFITGS